MAPRIAYFAHDLSDSAVQRRIRMLVSGGAVVTPIGFRRSSEARPIVEGVQEVELGRTVDGMLGMRALSVAGALGRLSGIAKHVSGTNVIIARNLEMLVLAIRARKMYAPTA